MLIFAQPRAIRRALDEARLTVSDVDAVAYTRGPGMYACLGVSAASAKALAAAYGKPILGVHHMVSDRFPVPSPTTTDDVS